MKIRRFGRTEFKISQLTFGGGWVGGIVIDPDIEIMHKALSLASEKGINWIDTAESYSEGKSEKNIGKLLSSFSNDVFDLSKLSRRLSVSLANENPPYSKASSFSFSNLLL